MRYRPFNMTGLSASAVTLLLDDDTSQSGGGSAGAGGRMRQGDWVKLVNAALEVGVNSFELAGLNPDIAQAIDTAVKAVGRRVLVLSLRLGRDDGGGFTPEGVRRQIAKALAHTGARYLDAVLLDNPAAGEIPDTALKALEAARSAGQISQIGLIGAGEATDKYISGGRFDLLATGFGVKSGWLERNRIKKAQDLGMIVTGYDFKTEAAPERVVVQRPKGLAGLFYKPDPAVVHAYDFLRETRGWTADELCLAFALTEPALATVRLETTSIKHLHGLAAAVERELPSGAAAQIEMARFAAAA